MPVQNEFLQEVKDALSHLYDYSYLESHPLALRYWPDVQPGGPTRAQRLHRLLLESIEKLHPPTASSQDTSRARGYLLLAYRYVEEWPLPDIMRELGYSRRQLFREQRKAIAMLAALLPQELAQPPRPPTEPDDLLAAEAGRVLAERVAVDLAEVIQGVEEAIRPLAEQQRVTMAYELDPRLPPVYGNRTLLRQVFLKTLSSLIAQPGTKRIHLLMRYEGQRAVAELVTQSGASGASPPDRAGWCLPDLGPVRRLVEIMGGHWLGFEAGSEGRTCRFDFPVGDQQVLLVIEDNEAVIRAFRRYLAGHSYQVVGATTGAEALRIARQAQPTAITLDIMMPTQDGWEILQGLKNDPTTRHIPVIICSVLEDPELTRSLGAAAYLRKPVTQADLLATLSHLRSAPQP